MNTDFTTNLTHFLANNGVAQLNIGGAEALQRDMKLHLWSGRSRGDLARHRHPGLDRPTGRPSFQHRRQSLQPPPDGIFGADFWTESAPAKQRGSKTNRAPAAAALLSETSAHRRRLQTRSPRRGEPRAAPRAANPPICANRAGLPIPQRRDTDPSRRQTQMHASSEVEKRR